MDVQRYEIPQTLAQACRLLKERPATMLAGGTDLMPQLRAGGRECASLLINIKHLAELRGIGETQGSIRIGALATVSDLLDSALLKRRAPIMVEVADCFASDQVRNAATIGGNICNASPAADLIIPLLLLDAEAELARWQDGAVATRRMPLCEMFVGPGATRIEPAEILTAVHFGAEPPDRVSKFLKFGTRPALDIAVVSVGVAGVAHNGCLRAARVAFGAVAPTPIRGRRTEAALEGVVLDERSIMTIARAALDDIAPISDVRASAWYRQQLVCELTARLLHEYHQAHN